VKKTIEKKEGNIGGALTPEKEATSRQGEQEKKKV
jgi:hypothetical protein